MGKCLSRPNPSVPNPATSVPPSSQCPVSSDPNKPTTDSSAASSAPVTALPVSPALPTSSPPSKSSPAQSTPPLPLAVPPVHVFHRSYHVPSIPPPILDLSPSSTAPESVVKHALLSDDRSKSSIALVGMGGAGKTTILCALGGDSEVKDKYYDGVWFFELGHDITLSSFIRHLEAFVKSTLPDFLGDFIQLAASEDTHRLMVTQLMSHLATKHFLFLFDDVWDVNASVYNLVYAMNKAVQTNPNSSLKVLMSTRTIYVAEDPGGVTVPISPEELDTDKTLRIFCHHARIATSDISSLSPHNQDALNSIVRTCAGLPLALSVAGSAVRQVMDPSSSGCDESAFGLYWERLKTKPRQVAGAEHGDGHKGLANALETSVQFLEERWELMKRTEELDDELGARDMFRSLCIMEKQMIVPVCVIERLWGVSDVEAGVMMLSRNSLVSEVREEGKGIVGVRVHDLVLDLSVKMCEGEGGVMKWHGGLVDSFEVSGNGRTGENEIEEEEWWKLKKTESEKYMKEHVVRHLLGAGRVYNVVKLLTDYRWIEEMNKDEERPAFRKVIGELEMLRKYLEEEDEKTESVRRIVRDLAVIVRAMELCMVPYCMKNREECTYQLFGRLRDVVSESGIVERLVCSVEQYGERPWARCGPGVLESERSSLRDVLELEGIGQCMCVGTGREVVVGGENGELWVLDGGSGTVKTTLVDEGERYVIVAVFFDHFSGCLYSCNRDGLVVIWKQRKKLRSVQAELHRIEWTKCMQVLPSRRQVILGTNEGRLLAVDIPSGKVVRTVVAHSDQVTSLAIGRSEEVIVSGSQDKTIRVWDTANFEDSDNVFEGHEDWVNSVALNASGSLLASASEDGSARLWDMQSGKQLWMSPDRDHSWVYCVLFSADERQLYSAGSGETRVWQVSSDGREVSLMHVLPNASTYSVESLSLGDGSDLFGFAGNQVQVWDARQASSTIDKSVKAYLQDVRRFAVSEDCVTMLTFNYRLKSMEIRNVCDVSERTDRVISSFKLPVGFLPQTLAVSNKQQFVAYSRFNSCVVFIVDSQNGNVLHSLSDLEEWALSSTSDDHEVRFEPSRSDDLSRTTRAGPRRAIKLISFSPDCDVITAYAVSNAEPHDANSTTTEKFASWNVSSGKRMRESKQDSDSTAMSTTKTPCLACNNEVDRWPFRYSPNVTYDRGASSFTIATAEGNVRGAHYIADTSRLHLLTFTKGMCYIDLVTDNTQLPPRDEPLLSLHPHPHWPFLQDTITSTEADEEYDVFISHAGIDKVTIALPLYNLLVALGFKVFLDGAELRPGANPAEKMIKAMRTAKIAVVILSPEYAVRRWTLKELMCFVERFRAGGEQEVIIIPVFYRLTLDDCRDQHTLFKVVNDGGENVFMAEGFLERMVEEDEYGIRDVVQALQLLRGWTGIENRYGVTNGDSEEERAAQMQFVEEIGDVIKAAMNRLEDWRIAGPSSARG